MNKGQSLFEVVLALAVISLILIALVTMAAISVRNSAFSRNKTAANRYTQKAVEWLRGERDRDWTAFYTKALPGGQVWCLKADPLTTWPSGFGQCAETDKISDTIFTRQATLIVIDIATVQVDVDTFWIDGTGEHHAKSSTLFTDWRGQ